MKLEKLARTLTLNTGHIIEILAVLVICIALLQVLTGYIQNFLFTASMVKKERMRLDFGKSIALALELLLAADVLSTAVNPTWNDIGQLAAIIVLRTLLNFILRKELTENTV